MSDVYRIAAKAYVTGQSPLGVPIEVVPMDRETKKPLVRWSTEAATTVDEVEALWNRFPGARVGLKLQKSPFLVLDLEGPGHGCDLAEVMQDMEDRLGVLPPSLTAATSGGGRHLFFRVPDDMSPDDFAEAITDPLTGQAIPGTEVKRGSNVTHGRCVLVPGRLDGASHDGRSWEDLTDVAVLPDSLRAAVTKRPHDLGPVVAPRAPIFRKGESGTMAGIRSLEGICSKVASAAPGNVNNALHWGSCRVGEYVASGHLDPVLAAKALYDAAIEAGHGLRNGRPDPAQRRAIGNTIASGMEKGLMAPRQPVGGHTDNAGTDETPPWKPISPLKALRAHGERPQPTLLRGLDGTALIYPGARVLMSGEPEAGKSWGALIIAREVVANGGRVLYVDSDAMGADALVERLRVLGLTDDELGASCEWTTAEGIESAKDLSLLTEYAGSGDFQLVVVDTWDPLLELAGLDSMSNGDVNTFIRIFLTPLHARGVTTVVCDHVVKNKENRGRFSAGAGTKLRPMEQHLSFVMSGKTMLSRDADGELTVRVLKDRPGALDRTHAYRIALRHTEGGRIAWDVNPGRKGKQDGPFRPTTIMEKVSLQMELADQLAGGRGTSLHSKTSLEKDVTGTASYIRQAIDLLTAEGYIVSDPSAKGKTLRLVRPYRQVNEGAQGAAKPDRKSEVNVGPVEDTVDEGHSPPSATQARTPVDTPSTAQMASDLQRACYVEAVVTPSDARPTGSALHPSTTSVGGSSPPPRGEPTDVVGAVRDQADAAPDRSHLNPLAKQLVERMTVAVKHGRPFEKAAMASLLEVGDHNRGVFEVAWRALQEEAA